MTITIVLADDHPLIRRGLRTVLESAADVAIVGEAQDGLEALSLVKRVKPQVLVVDIMMPGMNGLEVVREARQSVPATRAVVFSMYADDPYVLRALQNGASGYVLKSSPPTLLLQAIREVAAQRRFLDPQLDAKLIEVSGKRGKGTLLDRYDSLSSREREVFQLVAEGNTSLSIGKRLFISRRTVEVHRANLMRKLGLRTHADLIRYALKRGLLPQK